MTSRFITIGLLTAACCWAQEQQIDLSSLDKLEAKAKSVNRVDLNPEQMKKAGKIAQSYTGGLPKQLLGKVQAVQVRDFEFGEKGDYSDKDLDPIRKQVAALPGCSKIIDSKEKDEHSEIFMCSGDKLNGMAIIDAEPKEISVVIVHGVSDLSALQNMRGGSGDDSSKEDKSAPAK